MHVASQVRHKGVDIVLPMLKFQNFNIDVPGIYQGTPFPSASKSKPVTAT
jgi:hypothetical protein